MPDTVFAETMVLVKARLGAGPAIELGKRIRDSSLFLVVTLTADDYDRVWDIFSRYDDKEWSYIDCSILALARQLNIINVFGFDHHFDQMAELTRVPNNA